MILVVKNFQHRMLQCFYRSEFVWDERAGRLEFPVIRLLVVVEKGDHVLGPASEGDPPLVSFDELHGLRSLDQGLQSVGMTDPFFRAARTDVRSPRVVTILHLNNSYIPAEKKQR